MKIIVEKKQVGRDKHLLIGFDRSANLIEILYNEIDEDTVRVFHAMECRNSFKVLLNH